MGVAISELVTGRNIEMAALSGQRLAIDAHNFLYQFLSSIRGPDGSLLTNATGDVTSHIVGLVSRSISLLEHGVKIAFVFDGDMPQLKQKERERRRALKQSAMEQYEIAAQRQDFESMKKFASRTSSLTNAMIQDAQEICLLLGCPVIKAPSEGEAQAAYMVRSGSMDAVVSQDYDSLLFGADRIIRNLSVGGKRRKGMMSVDAQPVEILLSDVLNSLGIDREQLIMLAMLIGTDFNYGGIKGIGPKKGLQLIRSFGKDFEGLLKEVAPDSSLVGSWREIYGLFADMPVIKECSLQWKDPDAQRLIEVLVQRHGFSADRVQGLLDRLPDTAQKGLDSFF